MACFLCHRDPTPEAIARDVAVASLVAWFDVEHMAEGLRAFERSDRDRRKRDEVQRKLLASKPSSLPWWNQPGPGGTAGEANSTAAKETP